MFELTSSRVSLCSLLTAAFVLIAGCGGNDDGLRSALIAGLTRGECRFWIPNGEISVMSPLVSQMEPQDPDKRRFNDFAFNFVRNQEKMGLARIQERTQSELAAIGRMGERTFVVEPTSKARELASPQQERPGYLTIDTGECEIKSIVKDTSYISKSLPSSEEYRLVLGTFGWTPSSAWAAMFPDEKARTKRFRAIVKYDPFSKSYKFVRAELGFLEDDSWSPLGGLFFTDQGPWP